MNGRTLLAILLLTVMLLGGTFFLYVSVLPILMAAGALLILLGVAVVAAGSGHLPRWIELEEVVETRHAPRHSFRLPAWFRA